jgi:hypothetical protein
MDLSDHTYVGCKDPDHALLRHQPAIEACLPSIGRKEQEAEHCSSGEKG